MNSGVVEDIYIRYQKKYITIIKKLGIVIEPEEVAKIINNEPMSLSFEDDSDIEEFVNYIVYE